MFRVQVLLPMATFHKLVRLNPICVVVPLVGTQSSIEDGTLCENFSNLKPLQLEAFNSSTSYLASIKLTLDVCLAYILNVPLKAALSAIMKILVKKT